MGYRSEVAYVIRFRDEEKRKEFLALMKVRGDSLWEALKECGLDKHEPNINFYACDVKWYESYPDVKWHHDLLEWIDANYAEHAGWRFLRVGEEMGDTDDREGGHMDMIPYDDFNFYQGMEVPFSKETNECPIGKEEEHA